MPRAKRQGTVLQSDKPDAEDIFFIFVNPSEIQSSRVQTEMLACKNQCHLQFTGKTLQIKMNSTQNSTKKILHH